MKSPFTGGNVSLQQENSELVFRKEKFQYTYLYYECEDTKEHFTTTEIDELNLAQVYNANSLGVCYEGGLDVNGGPADTRTLRQKEAMHRLVANLLQSYPEARVVGHRDLSPDKNYNGIVDPWERTKECPCFEVKAEAWE